MESIKLNNEFTDVNKLEVKQSVEIDLKESWVYLNHDSEQFSMSLYSYKKFIELNINAFNQL